MEKLQKTYEDFLNSSDEATVEFTSFMDERKKLPSIMAEQGIEDVKQTLGANNDKWENKVLHIGVTGSQGAGKSAFINALRGMEAEDDGGAAVGVIETTIGPKPYKHPHNPNCILWDMPGVGTPMFPKEKYLEHVKFDRYDFFIIVSRARFTENDLWLAQQTQERKKRFYFIRSNMDIDIYNDSRANRKSHSPENVLYTVRVDCYRNLIKAGIKFPKVFLVDNYKRHRYDFRYLEAQLIEDFGSKKMEAMGLSLSNVTKDVLLNTYKDLVKSCDEVSEKDETPNLDIEADGRIDEEIKRLQTIMEKHGIEGVKQALRANSDKWKNTVLNIAVTGGSGAGKSALINALRGIEAEDDGGAAVGVKETTTDLTPYKHPKNPNFIVWDMPGVGTPKFPVESYLECVKFDQYDFFMIVSSGRFTEDDLWLAKQTQERKKRFYFIRSKIDQDIYNDSRSNPKSHTPEKVLYTVRDDCYKNLKKAGIEYPKVFLVDNHARQSYDVGPLEAQLLEDSDNIKMEAMALSLSTLTKEVLQKKKEVLEGRIENKAKEIACEMHFTDQKKIFEKEISNYKDQFNLDDKTLQENKVILKLSEENLTEFKTFVKTAFRQTANKLMSIALSRGPFERLIRTIRLIIGLDLPECIPVLEFSSISLQQNLDEMYRIALQVYDEEAQKGIVQSVLKLGKNSTTK